MVGENPTPYGVLALWAVNGLSIVCWEETPWDLLGNDHYDYATGFQEKTIFIWKISSIPRLLLVDP